MLDWLRTLSRRLSRLAESESERAFTALLESRPRLDDAAFYETSYAETGIPRDIPIRLRQLYTRIIGDDLSALQPQDNHALRRVEREFGLTISLGRAAREIDGTFDSVVRYLHKLSALRPNRRA